MVPTTLHQEGGFLLTVRDTTRICSDRTLISSDGVTPSPLQWYGFELIYILKQLGIPTEDELTHVPYTRQCLGRYIERELRKGLHEIELQSRSKQLWLNRYHTDVTEDPAMKSRVALATTIPQEFSLEKEEQVELTEIQPAGPPPAGPPPAGPPPAGPPPAGPPPAGPPPAGPPPAGPPPAGPPPAGPPPAGSPAEPPPSCMQRGLRGTPDTCYRDTALTLLLINTEVNSSRTTFIGHMSSIIKPGAEESKGEDPTDPTDLANLILGIHEDITEYPIKEPNQFQMKLDQHGITNKNPYDFIRELCEALLCSIESSGSSIKISTSNPVKPYIEISKQKLTREPFSIITHQTEQRNNLYYGYYCCGDQWYRYNSLDGTSFHIGDFDELMDPESWMESHVVVFLYAMDS